MPETLVDFGNSKGDYYRLQLLSFEPNHPPRRKGLLVDSEVIEQTNIVDYIKQFLDKHEEPGRDISESSKVAAAVDAFFTKVEESGQSCTLAFLREGLKQFYDERQWATYVGEVVIPFPIKKVEAKEFFGNNYVKLSQNKPELIQGILRLKDFAQEERARAFADPAKRKQLIATRTQIEQHVQSYLARASTTSVQQAQLRVSFWEEDVCEGPVDCCDDYHAEYSCLSISGASNNSLALVTELRQDTRRAFPDASDFSMGD
eukprot:TRINITY_DN122716_c0_g1_i1.p1 TRINITY_DN122716_c0_g1~~TRINITY_DN122716_c0_g1_i1.p1  ORF type:complete len:260 (+),score=39.15 TRINITY_DN122716_c0_g1_i1:312-1091(+)